ncbi:MAG TPA: hypothetical protein VGX45_11765, partial [Solirubrobacteraceae bacterium]|nr:hypothetical protein [Solirubrobacteraceae bacterium]
MRRAVAGLIAALPLALGVAVAHADQGGPWSGGGGLPMGVPVLGTVVTTDASAGTFTANAFVPTFGMGDGNSGSGTGQGQAGTSQGPWGGGGTFGGAFASGDPTGGGTTPTTTLVTIKTDSNTKMIVNGSSGTVADMKAGDQFMALFSGSPTASITTLVGNPALAIFDRTPPPKKQVYAFVGTVTGTDTTKGTVTLTVTASLPSGLAAANSSVTLTVSSDTLILGGTSSTGFGNALANVSTGDIVAGGLLAPQGDTLAQIEALPLQILVDLPVSSSTSSSGSSGSSS